MAMRDTKFKESFRKEKDAEDAVSIQKSVLTWNGFLRMEASETFKEPISFHMFNKFQFRK